MLDHERIDLFLGNGFRAAALANIHNLCRGCSETKNRLRNEIVMQNHIGRFNKADSLHGEQFWIARSGSDQRHMAGDGARSFPSRPRQLARGTRGRVADLPVRKLMEEQAAFLTAGLSGEDFPANFAEFGEPATEIIGKLLVDLATQALRQGGAFAGRGDGDLQVAAADHGAEKEIAVGNVVDTIAGNAARNSLAINRSVDFGHIGSCDHDEVAVKIGGLEFALDPLKLALSGELADFRPRLRRNHAQLDAGLEQAADLFERNRSRAHQQCGAAIEFQEDRK